MKNKKFGTVWLSLTYNCNSKCVWCYANSNNLNEKKVLDKKYESGIVNLISDLNVGHITMIGGEPTLYPNLFGLIKKIDKKNISIGMVTNGRKLSDYNFTKELKESGLRSLSFSIEGYDSKSHEKLTCSLGSYDKAMEGLENANKLGIFTSTNTVICKENINDLEKIVDSLENKTKAITFNFCGDCISEETNNKLILHPRETALAFQNIYDYTRNKDIRIKLVTPMPFCVFDNKYIDIFKKNSMVKGGPCQLTNGNNFVIEYNGNITPCTHFTDFSLMNIFGDENVISKDKFLKEYLDKDGIPEQFRNLMNKYPSKNCEDDKCSESCSGGCPLIYKLFSPDDVIIK